MSAVSPSDAFAEAPARTSKSARELTLLEQVDRVLAPLASQKIAVAMFAYGIFVIFIGTLAQTEMDIWQVMPAYFRAVIMWVDLNLIPSVFYPGWKTLKVPLIPMPGGMVVGVVMILNIAFAHIRWVLQLKTKMTPLLAGIGLVAFGWLFTLLIILNGHNRGGFQAQPPFSWEQFWTGFQLAMIATWVGAVFAYIWLGVQPAFQQTKLTIVRISMLGLFGGLLLAYSTLVWFLLFQLEFPGAEALRIMWQLLQGTLAGVVLLVGCWLVYQKRGGVVLLHQGLLLLMFNELFVAHYVAEFNMSLVEGQTTNYLRDIRSTELALIDRSNPEKDEHFVVPVDVLMANATLNEKLAKENKPPQAIEDPQGLLPVSVTVLQYARNADTRKLTKDEKSPATAGIGLKETIKVLEAAKGTDSDSAVDLAAAYVQFKDKKSGKDLGTFLLAQVITEQDDLSKLEAVADGDKSYLTALRFKRQYVPFTVQLIDVRKDDYVGTATPKNYSSDIKLTDTSSGIHSDVHIKMNDPLRYSGLTLYQSGYVPLPGGLEQTSLAVVRNNGFLIPYVAVMIITVGMIAHFLQTLVRFLRRRESEDLQSGDIVTAELAEPVTSSGKPGKKAAKAELKVLRPKQPLLSRDKIIGVIAASVIFLMFVGSGLRTPRVAANQFDFEAFGRLPVAESGRVKPLDTVARNALLLMRQREWAYGKKYEKIAANRWLLDAISGADAANEHRVIKIDDPDIRKMLSLKDTKGHVFAFNDLIPKLQELQSQVEAASKTAKDKQTAQQRGLIKIAQGMQNYIKLKKALTPLPLPSPEQLKANQQLAERTIAAFRMWKSETEMLKTEHPPRLIPGQVVDEKTGQRTDKIDWLLLPEASLDSFISSLNPNNEPDRRLAAFNTIIDAYVADNPSEFNAAVARYEALVQKADPPEYHAYKLELETWFNHFSPFYVGMILYVVAFLIAMIGWLIPSRTMSWTAFTLVVLTFIMHTAALGLRIYISGRPPVTNLYSSAIFIGWACVFFGIVAELVFRIGLGNLVATLCGFSTLIIAYFLGIDGDTIGVMQAVLDTQFWLATHVVCITLGYGATYFAGFMGLLYVILGVATPRLDGGSRKILARMIYGTTCFAIFFSFFGTVLGGLWADDSWGRFWGWDPKENGALIIVLWNALVLHARWDKLVGDRGLALLAIGGNIMTSWSWFGVNGLDVGLHSYGQKFGVMETLATFVLSQLIIITIGLIPLKYWWSVRQDSGNGPAAPQST
ncbi:Cytochrome c biogenesis protein CcsA [Anatilimnocola aggregata]|uniref:Cytochrome c biogenesis protein CcsA n=1 Tax=Anatilimnocola aggregata TaxID=2528021 RepID=A0A517YNY5_9BACT|nr:cytochrome c biogenesis protein CcsA [Anatilimnocola aggregata]QDU31936.1 Cytochrome c biogenesis protein CcsA [Anatilimnocola aggregata]